MGQLNTYKGGPSGTMIVPYSHNPSVVDIDAVLIHGVFF